MRRRIFVQKIGHSIFETINIRVDTIMVRKYYQKVGLKILLNLTLQYMGAMKPGKYEITRSLRNYVCTLYNGANSFNIPHTNYIIRHSNYIFLPDIGRQVSPEIRVKARLTNTIDKI